MTQRASALIAFGFKLLAALTVAATMMPATHRVWAAPPDAEKQKAALEERDRLWAEAVRLSEQEKWKEALAIAQKVLKLQNEHLGRVHPHNCVVLQAIADWYESKYEFLYALHTYHELKPICEQALGPNHWRTVTARLHAEMHDRVARLDYDGRQEAVQAALRNHWSASLHRIGKDTGALEYAQDAVKRRTALFGRKYFATATSLTNLGVAYMRLGLYSKAQPVIEESLALHQQSYGQNHPTTLNCLTNLAAICSKTKDYKRAEKLYKEIVEKYRTAFGAEDWQTIQAHGNLGEFYLDRGDLAQAKTVLLEVLQNESALYGAGNPAIGRRLELLGSLYHKLGDDYEAAQYYQQSVDLHRSVLGDTHHATGRSLAVFAEFAQSIGDVAKAEGLFRKALEAQHKEWDQHADEANILVRLGTMYRDRLDYARAESYLRRALRIYRERVTDTHPSTAKTRAELATVLVRLNRNDEAEKLVADALAMLRNTIGPDQPDTYAVMLQMADVCLQQKQYDKAEKLLHEVMPNLTDDLAGKGTARRWLAQIALEREDYKQAQAIVKSAYDAHSDQVDIHELYWTDLFAIGATAYMALGNIPEASSYLHIAVITAQKQVEVAGAGQSERQQITMAAGLRHVLDQYLSLPEKEVSAEEAYDHVIRWKGAVLARQVRDRRERRAGASPLAKKLQDVCTRLTLLSLKVPDLAGREQWLRELDWLKDERDTLEAQLALDNHDAPGRPFVPPVTHEQLRAAIPRGTALVDVLEYQHLSFSVDQAKPVKRTERRLAAFIIRPDQPIVRVEMGSAQAIEKAIEAWRRGVKRAKPSDAAALLRKLVWQPWEKHLDGCHTVLFSPDASLSRMPLYGIPGRKAGSFLIEDVAIATLAVPQLLPELVAAPRVADGAASRAPALLLVGNVDYNAPTGQRSGGRTSTVPVEELDAGEVISFTRLESTGKEIRALDQLFRDSFPEGKVVLLEKGAATEAAFRSEAPQSSLLLLATHGFFAPPGVGSALAVQDQFRFTGTQAGYNASTLSGLALAGANASTVDDWDDGLLTAMEVATLDLRKVDLAVLSGCETGLGQISSGEGALGLQRAFQVAGARTAVASLWNVPDQKTSELMQRFYSNLWSKKLSKIEAFREAQLWMMRTGGKETAGESKAPESTARQAPYYWAAFVLSGDWR